MNVQQIALVQQSLILLEDQLDELAVLFYQRLFELAPELRPLFPRNLHQQGTKFMSTLAFIISLLQNPETMIPTIKQLGQRHATYGVRPEHYRLLSLALFAALEQTLGDAFTPPAAQAWYDVYYLTAGLMKEAANQVTYPQAYQQIE